MKYCKKCEVAEMSTGTIWVLANETQMCIWASPTEMPEVDIENAVSFAYYCSEQHAKEAIAEYLLQIGATEQWSSVRPIETCASCEQDFDTTTWHQVLVLSEENGPITNPEPIDYWYVARFCNKCVPVEAHK